MVLVTNPLPSSAIATLTGFENGAARSLLESVQSLLVLHEDAAQPIQPFHNSFPDFMMDPSRCSDLRSYISPDLHTGLVLRRLKLMHGSLKKDMFSIPDYALNSDVEDLRRVGESGIDSALVYACRSWHNHLVVTESPISDVLSALHRLLEEKFVFWLEVLSALGAVGDAARALTATLKWLNEVSPDLRFREKEESQRQRSQIKASVGLKPLLHTTTNCLRFVTEFFEVISESAPHIYHSALPLAPASSIIRKLYGHQISSAARVVTGIPASWDSCMAIVGATSEPHHAIWSPCGQYIATGSGKNVEVRDSITLETSYILKPPRFGDLRPNLAFFARRTSADL